MRRLILAVAGLVGAAVVAVPATASAAPLTICGDESCSVTSTYWDGGDNNTWAESVPNGNWYLSYTNDTEIYGVGTGSWQEYRDDNNGLCMTLDWNTSGTDKILDEVCQNHPSQLWASHTFGNSYTYYIYNQYLTPARAQCTNGHQAVIDAPSPTAGLTMRCVETNGDPLPEQLWDYTAP